MSMNYVDPMDRSRMTARLGGRDPDAALVALFKHHAIPNEAATAQAGRPMFDDMEVCEIRFPGSRAVSVFPATAQSDWVTNPYTGASVKRTYAERFAHEYQQFKSHVAQTKTGTPLQYVPFLTEGRRAELQALNIYTVEALATVDGQELKNLGPYGRDLKNQAEAFLADATRLAPSTQLQAEYEALKARALALEEDNKALQQTLKAEASGDAMLDSMSDAQLKDFISTNTGSKPVGNLGRKTLLRMALDARPAKAA